MIDFIIPYRNRPTNLKEFTEKFPIFAKSKCPGSTVTVIEQSDDRLFNYGALCNIGFDFLDKHEFSNKHFGYFPVDMIPQEIEFYDGVDHSCYLTVLDGYIYPKAFVFKKGFYKNINGFSNSFEGYGREDDDLFRRIDKLEPLRKFKMECEFLEPDNVPSDSFKNRFLNHNSNVHPPPECGLSSVKYEEVSTREVNGTQVVVIRIF